MSGKYSDTPEEQDTAQRAESLSAEIRSQLLGKGQLSYANDMSSTLVASARTFSLIVRHRDYLFDRIETLKKNELTIYQNLQSASLSVQSLLPRLSGIAIGGYTIPTLLSKVLSVPIQTSYLVVAAFGGLGYLITELLANRWGGKKVNDTIKHYEDEKDKCYVDFLERSRMALRLLVDDVVRSYQANVDQAYSLSDEKKEEIVDDIIRSAEKIEETRKTN